MEKKSTGWVIINIGHPNNGRRFIVGHTFSRSRSEAIKVFIDGGGTTWKYWYRKFNFRAVRAEMNVRSDF